MGNMIESPKKINILDKIKIKIKELLGYKEGKRFTIDVEPYIKKYSDIELMKVANIEEKLQQVLKANEKEGYLQRGIEEKEALLLLEWTVQNARKGLVKEGEDIRKKSFSGYCGLGQGITATALRNMGLSPYVVNANPTLSKEGGRHAFVAVNIPLIGENRSINNKMYLVDTTFKQFYLRDEITNEYGDYIEDKKFGNRVAPIPGYWLLKMGKKGEEFSKKLLSEGFIELTEENAKMYGDSFVLECMKRENGSRVPNKKEMNTGISGNEYIRSIMNQQMQDEIDYDDGELEGYGINVSTPLMEKKKIGLMSHEQQVEKGQVQVKVYEESKEITK